MNIIGIDLGTRKAAATRITGTFKSLKFDRRLYLQLDKKKSINDRFFDIITYIWSYILSKETPELVVVEYPFGIQGNANILKEMVGVFKWLCRTKKIPFLSISQSRIKKYATGSGKAEKSDMRMQLYKEFNLDWTEDETDSFWIAHMGLTYTYGSKVKFRQASIDAMRKNAK